jgi:Raf kinase inhibitor-like YbhB/YbcL family protein
MQNSTTTSVQTLAITSSAFKDMELIPKKYSCDGDNTNPPLEIHDVDVNAKSLVLIMEDPDAPHGTFDHWIKFNIPPDTIIIEEGKEPQGVAGLGTKGTLTYHGPCPPSGSHRYVFRIISLDTEIPLAEGASKNDIEHMMAGHILQESQLIGLYSRQ